MEPLCKGVTGIPRPLAESKVNLKDNNNRKGRVNLTLPFLFCAITVFNSELEIN